MADPRLSIAALGDTSALLRAVQPPAKPASTGPDASADRGQATAPRPTSAREFRRIAWKLLARFVNVTEEMIDMTGGRSDEMPQFSLRLDQSYLPLPPIPADPSKRVPGSAAKYLLLGSLQQFAEVESNGASRVTMRIVSAETSEVTLSGKGTAKGMDAQTVDIALKEAFLDLGMVFGVPGAVVRT